MRRPLIDRRTSMQTPVLRKVTRPHYFAVSFILILLTAPLIVAQTQSTTGTIEGTVEDANGAAVAGANVEVKNIDTNITKSATTDEAGRFTFLALQPGNYSVTVSKQGFGNSVSNATLTVGQALPIKFTLTVS